MSDQQQPTPQPEAAADGRRAGISARRFIPKMPAWWEPWHTHQCALSVALILNAFWGFAFVSPASALNWIAVGGIGCLLWANTRFRKMFAVMDQMNTTMRAIMQVSTEEIGASIAKHINEDMGRDSSQTTVH